MTYFLRNTGGRIVPFEDERDYQYWLTKGFTKPSEAEIEAAVAEKTALKRRIEQPLLESDVYLATVSQGAKDGYGVASAKLIDELSKLGVKISTEKANQTIGLLFHNPYSILRLENRVRILYTMFESTKIPDDWKDYLEAADIVIVPSKWCKKVFERYSDVKCKVIPLGYDANTFQYIKRENKRDARKDFIFLHYNAFNLRKGFIEVFKAFTEEFEPGEPVKMIFKTTLNQIPAALPIIPSMYPNIRVMLGAISDFDLAKLCGQCDAFVWPSRGEGFGVPPLEAMATGLPTIVPNAHGISEYFNAEYMYECQIEEEVTATYSRYKGIDVGKMFKTDVKDLRRQMRYIYEHQDEAQAVGQAASEYVKKWTFENTAKQFKKLFDDISSKPIPERAIKNVLPLERYT